MTIDEFFVKKKIDLVQLKAANEPLFQEIVAHYEAMGPKSFDHTKKYLFNNWRKDYLLKRVEEVKK